MCRQPRGSGFTGQVPSFIVVVQDLNVGYSLLRACDAGLQCKRSIEEMSQGSIRDFTLEAMVKVPGSRFVRFTDGDFPGLAIVGCEYRIGRTVVLRHLFGLVQQLVRVLEKGNTCRRACLFQPGITAAGDRRVVTIHEYRIDVCFCEKMWQQYLRVAFEYRQFPVPGLNLPVQIGQGLCQERLAVFGTMLIDNRWVDDEHRQYRCGLLHSSGQPRIVAQPQIASEDVQASFKHNALPFDRLTTPIVEAPGICRIQGCSDALKVLCSLVR